MDCPRCGSATRVLESRRAEDGAALRRRRRCPECEHRFTTFERSEPDPLTVIKRDGTRQRFDRAKLLSGLVRASHKRDVDPRDLEAIADRIEREAGAAGGELSAARVGELCLEGLEPLDRGAFLQFAGTLPDGFERDLRNPRKKGGSKARLPSEPKRMLSGPRSERARGVQ
ncbi:MAG TPA: transcriptional regulator NrdR [Solirubrobacterales bacterium]|jgi:transcriptional repressor NrdR|nr:transcriptional regulator NrdR [Solirubrobacterales bacterium]